LVICLPVYAPIDRTFLLRHTKPGPFQPRVSELGSGVYFYNPSAPHYLSGVRLLMNLTACSRPQIRPTAERPCRTPHAHRAVQPDSFAPGGGGDGASRWANCLSAVLTPIIISQTSAGSLAGLPPGAASSARPSAARASRSCAWLTALTSAHKK